MPVNLLPALRSLPLGLVPDRLGQSAATVHWSATAVHRMVTTLLADVPTMSPDSSQLPGGALLANLMDGLQFWALALALVGLVIGAAAWALGVHAQNFQQSMVGRRAVLVSGLAALLIGAAPPIVNFFFNAGHNLH